jgi:hypothetical protein
LIGRKTKVKTKMQSELECIIEEWVDNSFLPCSESSGRIKKPQFFKYFVEDTGSNTSYDKFMSTFWNVVRELPHEKYNIKTKGNKRSIIAGLRRKILSSPREVPTHSATTSSKETHPVIDIHKITTWKPSESDVGDVSSEGSYAGSSSSDSHVGEEVLDIREDGTSASDASDADDDNVTRNDILAQASSPIEGTYSDKLSKFNMKNCNDYLQKMLPSSKSFTTKRNAIWARSRATNTFRTDQLRAFVAYHFRPISVTNNNIADSYVGDRFPQFSAVSESSSASSLKARCEICIPFQHWSINNNKRCPRLKSTKFATAEQIANGEGFIEFEGITQMTVHSQTKYHQAAIKWLEDDVLDTRSSTVPTPIVNIPTTKPITAYFPKHAGHLN